MVDLAITSAPFGTSNGKDVLLYTLTNANGLVAKITNYGAILVEFYAPDRTGKIEDVVLGYPKAGDYIANSPYFGATVGRVANRIRNATFELEGQTYELAANDGPHSLHGGLKGLDKVVWDAQPADGPDGPSLKLSYVSRDGDEGYPSTLTAITTYTLTNQNELKIEMSATTDHTTIVNIVHHTYWNLRGESSGPVVDHELQLHASHYTPGDATLVPIGVVQPVRGTPFDFTQAKPIGKDLAAAGGKPVGYDHNWVVDGDPHVLRKVARLHDPVSGRVMTLEADQPGVQFYSGNFLDGSMIGKSDKAYPQYGALCLETQRFPNSVNVPAWRNEVVLRPGDTYVHRMVHRFSAV